MTVLEGIKNKVSSNTKVTYVKGCNVIGNDLNEISKAQKAARNAEVAIVVVGENERKADGGRGTNGEGADVASLDLTGFQEELLKAVHATGTPTIVVLINGRPLSVRWTAENIPVILEAWICGEEGGNAIAEVYVSVDVKNTGKRDGREVVQLYIDDVLSSMSTPIKELKGFEKLSLAADEEKTVRFKLTPEHMSFLNRNLETVVEPGMFDVMVGSSSQDIRLKGEFEVK